MYTWLLVTLQTTSSFLLTLEVYATSYNCLSLVSKTWILISSMISPFFAFKQCIKKSFLALQIIYFFRFRFLHYCKELLYSTSPLRVCASNNRDSSFNYGGSSPGHIHFITVIEIWAHASLCDSVLAVSCYNLFLEDALLSEGMTSRFMSVPLALLWLE